LRAIASGRKGFAAPRDLENQLTLVKERLP